MTIEVNDERQRKQKDRAHRSLPPTPFAVHREASSSSAQIVAELATTEIQFRHSFMKLLDDELKRLIDVHLFISIPFPTAEETKHLSQSMYNQACEALGEGVTAPDVEMFKPRRKQLVSLLFSYCLKGTEYVIDRFVDLIGSNKSETDCL